MVHIGMSIMPTCTIWDRPVSPGGYVRVCMHTADKTQAGGARVPNPGSGDAFGVEGWYGVRGAPHYTECP